ncbi:MAG: penicillin-binding protein 1C [Pseudomonadota bacterium]
MIWLRRLGFAALILVGFVLALDRLFPPPLERGTVISRMVFDADGQPLRAFPLTDGRWRFATHLSDLDPVFVDALLAVEDKRFWQHGGVDWLGLVRAAGTSLAAGEIVSGGSTITMQTARLLEPRRRTIGAKLIEILRAHQIEARLTKQQILELYLTLTPYGGNLEGVRAASWRYFERAPDRLSDDQIALLIALPQAPEGRRPDRRPDQAIAGRNQIAKKLERLGFFSNRRAEDVVAMPLTVRNASFPSDAWQAAERIVAGQEHDVVSTLDRRLQLRLQNILAREAAALSPDTQIAALIVETDTRHVRAAIGAAMRDRPGGWLDLTNRNRSPGSTLKPLIYGMAFEDGVADPATRIADLPKRFQNYQPDNFDRTFRGDVTIAEALQHSLNVPAVLVLDRIGPERFAANLRSAGAAPALSQHSPEQAGLALALGGASMTAQQLAVLYAGLADGGLAKPLVWHVEEHAEPQSGHRLMSPDSAKRIIDILKQTPAPAGRMPGQLASGAPKIAFKTGTSYGFRDAWAAGVSGDYVIIVWVGRPDGAPRPGQTGRTAALPLLFDIADIVHDTFGRSGSAIEAGVMRTPRAQSVALTRFEAEDRPPEILFPPKDAELWAGEINGKPARPFAFAGRGEGALRWYVDGAEIAKDGGGLAVWAPPRNGFYMVSAVDPIGRTSRVAVRVRGVTRAP